MGPSCATDLHDITTTSAVAVLPLEAQCVGMAHRVVFVGAEAYCKHIGAVLAVDPGGMGTGPAQVRGIRLET